MARQESRETDQQLLASGDPIGQKVAPKAVKAPVALRIVLAWPARPTETWNPRATSTRMGLIMAFVRA